jgi:hypothetical protein
MNIWTLILHLREIYSALYTLEVVVQACIKEKRMPTSTEINNLISIVEGLLQAGVLAAPAGMTKAEAVEGLKISGFVVRR